MNNDGTPLETMGRVIPFRPRGGPVAPEPEPPPEPVDRDTAGALRVILIAFGIVLLFAAGVLTGWILGAAHKPEQLLNVLEHRLQPEGVVLTGRSASLLVYPPHGPPGSLVPLPVRLSGQSIPPERRMGLLGARGIEPTEAPPFSNRELELALLIAIEDDWEPALLHGFARLTLSQASEREDLLRAQKALILARQGAPQDVDLLNDLAAITLALGDTESARAYLEEADVLLEDYDPAFKPVLYNRALLERGSSDPHVELSWLQTYLGIEGGSFWSRDMRLRYEALEAEGAGGMGGAPNP